MLSIVIINKQVMSRQRACAARVTVFGRGRNGLTIHESKTEKSLYQCGTYLCLSVEPSDAFARVVRDRQTDRRTGIWPQSYGVKEPIWHTMTSYSADAATFRSKTGPSLVLSKSDVFVHSYSVWIGCATLTKALM